MDVKTKGQSMTLSYWRERAHKLEEERDGYSSLWNESEAKISEARRIAGNQRSQKNYWKRKAVKLAEELAIQDEANDILHRELDSQKARRQLVENMNNWYTKIAENDAQTIVSWTDIAKAKMLESEKNKRCADILGLTWLTMLIIEMWS